MDENPILYFILASQLDIAYQRSISLNCYINYMRMGQKMSRIFMNSQTSDYPSFENAQPSSSSPQRMIPRSMVMVSDLVSCNIEPVQPPSVLELQKQRSKPEPIVIQDDHVIEEKTSPYIASPKKSSKKNKTKIILKGPVTVKNFTEHLKDLWKRDPTLTKLEFFQIAKKLFNLIENEDRVSINLNRMWSNRSFNMMKQESSEYLGFNDGIAEKELNQSTISETFYEMLSEPESKECGLTVANNSKLWRNHTLKLLKQKYPWQEGRRKRRRKKGMAEEVIFDKSVEKDEEESGDLWVVNKAMVKTLQNKQEEMLRLQREIIMPKMRFYPRIEEAIVLQSSEGSRSIENK